MVIQFLNRDVFCPSDKYFSLTFASDVDVKDFALKSGFTIYSIPMYENILNENKTLIANLMSVVNLEPTHSKRTIAERELIIVLKSMFFFTHETFELVVRYSEFFASVMVQNLVKTINVSD